MQPSNLIKAIKALAYLAIAAVPLVFFRYSMFPFGIPKIFFFESLVTLMAGAYLGLIVLEWPSKRHVPRPTPALLAAGAFSLVLILAGAFGVDPFRSFWSTIDRTLGVVGILHFVVFYAMLNGLRREMNWPRIWSVSFWSASLVGLSVLLSKWGLWSFFLRQNESRPGGTFGNATFAGAYMLFNVFLAGWLWQKAEKFWQKALIVLGAFLQVAAIFVAQTIGIIAGLAAGLAFLLVLWAIRGSGKRKKISLGVIGLGFVFGLILLFTRDAALWQKVPGLSRVAAISFEQSDVQDRLVAWRSSVEGFKERPLLGWGWENGNIPFNANYDPKLVITTLEGTFFDKPHNVYLEHLVTGGLLGLAAYLAILIALVLELRRGAAEGDMRRMAPYFGAALLAYVLQNAIAFDTIGTYLMLFLLLGTADAYYAVETQAGEVEAAAPAWKTGAAYAAVMLGILPVIFLSGPTLVMANQYYWGANYFLNQLTEASKISWDKALAMRTPYRDYVRKDYASTVMQGFGQGVYFPEMDKLQAKLADEFEKIGAHHPKDYFFQIALADYYVTFWPFDKEDYMRKIEEHLASAKELSPKRQQIYYVEARAKLLKNDKEGALQAIREAIALNPEAGDPHFTYGMLAYGLGDVQTGSAEIRRAAELGRVPRNPEEAIRLAGFVGDGSGDYKASSAYLRQALDMALKGVNDHQIKDIRLKLGVACYLSGQPECAKEQFETLFQEVDPTKLPIWENLKPALEELGVKY